MARPNGVGAGWCQAQAPFFPHPAVVLRPLKLLWLSVRSWGLALRHVSMFCNEVRECDITQPDSDLVFKKETKQKLLFDNRRTNKKIFTVVFCSKL